MHFSVSFISPYTEPESRFNVLITGDEDSS